MGTSSECLVEAIQKLYKNKTVDFAVETVDKTLLVHRFILAGRSDIILKLLAEGDEEDKQFLEIKEFPTSTVEQMIQFLYGFEIPDNFKDVTNLYALAEKYSLQDLKGIILKRLDNITRENFLQTAEMAEVYNLEELTEKCATFCVTEAAKSLTWKKKPETDENKLENKAETTTISPKEAPERHYTFAKRQTTKNFNFGGAAASFGASTTPKIIQGLPLGFGAPSTPVADALPLKTSSATETGQDLKPESAALPAFGLWSFKLERKQLKKLPKLATALAMKHFENLSF